MNNLKLIRQRGFSGDLVARMTVTEGTDIYQNVRYLRHGNFRPRSLAAKFRNVLEVPLNIPGSRIGLGHIILGFLHLWTLGLMRCQVSSSCGDSSISGSNEFASFRQDISITMRFRN